MTSPRQAARRALNGAIGRIILCAALAATLPNQATGQGVEAVAGGSGLLWLPADTEASTPLPVVVAVHDSLGLDQRGWRYSQQLTAAGIAVLHVELQDVSADGFAGTPARDEPAAELARLADAIDGIARDSRFADAAVGLLAFGAAGQAAMRAATDPATAGRIAAMALLYPGCAAIPVPTPVMALQAPVLLLHGDADPANPPADCAGLAAGIARSAPVRRRQYAGAGYAWDLPSLAPDEVRKLPRPDRPGTWVFARYWPEAAEFSAAQIASFFAATVGPRP